MCYELSYYPPLVLRLSVPTAGTAAIFALDARWRDAQNVYGGLIREGEEAYTELQEKLAFWYLRP